MGIILGTSRRYTSIFLTKNFVASVIAPSASCGIPESAEGVIRSQEGPAVRILFPPAVGQVRTCLSREFAFLGREAAVFPGCPGLDERPGRQRHVGRENIWPKGGDISVGPYSSTAPPVMRSATMPRILSRMRSPMTSRSNYAKDNKTFRVRRPIEVVVLNCCVTETKDAPLASLVGRETH
jgi:hypothetical protein